MLFQWPLTFSMGKISYQMCYINGGVSRGFEIELANSTSSHNGLSLARLIGWLIK